jgi:HD-GYP domain-containing protein (c-di-GMP phosphodiesterase class II)
MLQTFKTKDLKVGMFIIISTSWHQHPFFKNSFIIRSERQIKKLIESGINKVAVDTEKGHYEGEAENDKTHPNIDLPIPQKWEPEKLIPHELKEVIDDRKMAPPKKAQVVYDISIGIMNKLLTNPTHENINEFKAGVTDIVDMILKDHETSRHLLNITSHDYYTYTHSVNVGVLSVLLSKALFKNRDAHDMHELGAGFFLHDIGKVNIDSALINKRGKFTEEEMAVMRTHPEEGFKILSERNQLSKECKIIVMQHHERVDGSGYPYHLQGDEIHVYGRICCISDVFDALTSERPYKVKLPPFDALKLMKKEMLHHFHKEIFDTFVLLFGRS